MQKTTDHILGDHVTPAQADQALALIKKAANILIISHRHPDADSIGANLAIKLAFQSPDRHITSCASTPLPKYMSFIGETHTFDQEIDLKRHDLIISVDCASVSQLGFEQQHPTLSSSTKNFINIDHHSTNTLFGTLNLVSSKISSTAELIFRLLTYWEISITPEMATLLLSGLYYDTGSFMHSNATAEVMDIAHELTLLGADINKIIRGFYQNFNEEKFHLWGDLLSNFQITEDGVVASVVKPEDLQKHHIGEEDLLGIIDYLSSAKESAYTVFLNQSENTILKGSLRTRRNDLDLSVLAKELGGGGHKKACGFSLPAALQKQTIWKIKPGVNQS